MLQPGWAANKSVTFNQENVTSIFIGILVSHGCCNQLPQTWCLRTAETDSLIVLEARSLKSVSMGQNQGVGSALLPPEALGENPFLAFPAPGICQHSLICGRITPVFQASFLKSLSARSSHHLFHCVFLILLSLVLVNIHVIAFRAHPDKFRITSHPKILHLLLTLLLFT